MAAKKVLILSASAGNGHVRAAQALEKAFAAEGGNREVRHVDALTLTNKVFRTIYSKMYIDLVDKAPDVLGWLYDALDSPWQKERRRLAWDKLNTRPVREDARTRAARPDRLHALHAGRDGFVDEGEAQARLPAGDRRHRLRRSRDVALPPLRALHGRARRDARAHDQARHPAREGLDDGHPDRSALRRDEGQGRDAGEARLAADKTTILLSAGGFGVGPVEHIVTTLRGLEHPAQIVAICGKNAELLERMQKLAAKPGGGQGVLVPVGYTTAMDEYMSAADVLVGKPGGLTTSEALAKGLLFVIVNPIPGQEERNSDHLLEAGAAIRCNNLPVLAYKLDRLLDDAPRITRMRQNVARLAHPNAARDVVRIALDLAR
jgi:processive 1,2-diacylglycerol beta-glucosyltransferase